MKKTHWFPVLALALCALVLWTVQGLALTLVQVRGPSMVPSYADGQVLFVNRLAYGLQGPIIGDYLWIWKAPNLGDAVVLRRPGETTWVVKRVVGLGGMPLKVEDHHLLVANRSIPLSLAQEYWLSACPGVPVGSLFVVGDNVDHSLDSRDWGFVPFRDVLGRSFF